MTCALDGFSFPYEAARSPRSAADDGSDTSILAAALTQYVLDLVLGFSGFLP